MVSEYRSRLSKGIFVIIFLASSVFEISPTLAAPSLQDNDPSTQCAMGIELFGSGNFSEAMPLVKAGFTNREKASFATPDDLGKCALVLGILYASTSQLDNALEADLVALEVFRISGNKSFEAASLANIGEVYRLQGRFTLALEYYQQSLGITRITNDRGAEGRSLNALGLIYNSQGRYAEALDHYQQALLIAKEVGDEWGQGTTLHNIGFLYQLQGRNTEALQYYKEGLEIAREIGDRQGEGISLNNIGGLHNAQGQSAEALKFYKQALAIMREVGDRMGENNILNNIGGIYLAQGQFTEALDQYELALANQRETGDRASESYTLNNIGTVYEEVQKYDDAMEHYQEALDIVQEIGDKAGEATLLANIGRNYEVQGQYDKALQFDEQAMNILEDLRASAGSETGRASFIAKYSFLYDRTISLYYQQNQPEKAFFTAERGRSRAFLDSLATGYIELSDNEDAILYNQEQEAYSALQVARDLLAKSQLQNPPDENLIQKLEAQLALAEKSYQAAADAINLHGVHLDQLVPGRNKVLDVFQVQSLLDGETTLLSFWVLDNQTLVFVLTHETFNTISLPISRKDLYAHIETFRSFASTDTAYPESAIVLYQALIEPIIAQLTNYHLIIIPQAKLHYLPFAALTNGQRYLVDDFMITYLPSASTLPFIQQNAQGTGSQPLIIGNPVSGNYDATATLATERDQLGPLPFAEEEAKAIANRFGIQAVIGNDATESLVKQQSSQLGVLHLAAHGVFNPTAPLSSLIALAPDNENDGWLTVSEVYGLDLHNTDLVVLSACDTQVGQLTASDEFIGLTRAFFFAGAPTVVASLWSVDDQATKQLMEKFYSNWQGGMNKAEALRQAQITVRTDYPNPYYWAAFVLSGERGETRTGGFSEEITPEPTSEPEKPSIPMCGGNLALVGIILFAAKWKRRRV